MHLNFIVRDRIRLGGIEVVKGQSVYSTTKCEKTQYYPQQFSSNFTFIACISRQLYSVKTIFRSMHEALLY